MNSALHLVRRRRARRVGGSTLEDGFERLLSRESDDFFRSETQPAFVGQQDPKLAHLQIAALAKNLSMLDSLEEDLVKALDDLETAAHQAQLSQLGSVSAAYKFLRGCFRGQTLQDVTPLMEPLLSNAEEHHATSTPRQRASEQRQRFLSPTAAKRSWGSPTVGGGWGAHEGCFHGPRPVDRCPDVCEAASRSRWPLGPGRRSGDFMRPTMITKPSATAQASPCFSSAWPWLRSSCLMFKDLSRSFLPSRTGRTYPP
ncbi:Kidins220 [Symbiodinium necroappetens]|uniref:Kidins220 protein n=1 Tax=Symbiodinium necroappetens TaxID=1628268 RepID=A0A812JTJ5_9DINO|nr:Kidins220 [Symbiodinium necroappetens]